MAANLGWATHSHSDGCQCKALSQVFAPAHLGLCLTLGPRLLPPAEACTDPRLIVAWWISMKLAIVQRLNGKQVMGCQHLPAVWFHSVMQPGKEHGH